MRGMIFAAGIGSRLKPWTDEHPKALVPVGGIPMLERVILKFKEADIKEIVVNVHHFASQITDFLAANDNFGITIKVSDESGKLLDTGGGLLRAAHLFQDNEPILIHNVDIYTDFALTDMEGCFEASHADALLLIDRRDSSRCLYFDNTGMMRGWGNRSTGETKPAGLDTTGLEGMSFGGVHIINPSTLLPALANYTTTDVFSITNFYIDACRRLAIKGYTPSVPYNWVDVGKPESLARAQQLFE